ncbi:MAG: hypothetical protein AB1896_05860 [Thermodesulfobacteriota bacterium]
MPKPLPSHSRVVVIGGAVAEVVGRKLKVLSRHHQLLCLTHLPQIAMYGRRTTKSSRKSGANAPSPA